MPVETEFDDAALLRQLHAFGATLERSTGEPIRADSHERPVRPGAERQRPWLWLAVAASLLLVVGGAVWSLRPSSETRVSTDSAGPTAEPVETAVGQAANVDVVGLTESEASGVLEQQGLVLDLTAIDVEAGSDDVGRVLAQFPEPGGAIEAGSSVELFVGRVIEPSGRVIEPSPYRQGEQAPPGIARTIGEVTGGLLTLSDFDAGWERLGFTTQGFAAVTEDGCAADEVLGGLDGTTTQRETWRTTEPAGFVLTSDIFVLSDVTAAERVQQAVGELVACDRFNQVRDGSLARVEAEVLTSAALGLAADDTLRGVWSGPPMSMIATTDGTNVVIVSTLSANFGSGLGEDITRSKLAEVHQRNLNAIDAIGPGQTLWPIGKEPPLVSGVFVADVRDAFDARDLDVDIEYRLVGDDAPSAGRAIEVRADPDGTFTSVIAWSRTQPTAFRDRSVQRGN